MKEPYSIQMSIYISVQDHGTCAGCTDSTDANYDVNATIYGSCLRLMSVVFVVEMLFQKVIVKSLKEYRFIYIGCGEPQSLVIKI